MGFLVFSLGISRISKGMRFFCNLLNLVTYNQYNQKLATMKKFIVKQGLTIGMMVEDETDTCYLVIESKDQMLKLDELVANQLICVESAIMNKNASLGLNTIELFAQ